MKPRYRYDWKFRVWLLQRPTHPHTCGFERVLVGSIRYKPNYPVMS